ncbi:MAG: DUF4493 domain-containing protein [Tannerellaceae bacterium]|nr:DUF4493 domain-containing protein [Tannerellaceae bacterium]
MKKRFRNLLRWKNTCVFLSLLGTFLYSTSCSDDKDLSTGSAKGLAVFDVKTESTFTRSTESSEKGFLDPAEYTIQIWDAEGKLVNTFLLGDENEVELEAGTYNASATWGEDIAAGLGEEFIYMEGSKDFTIEEEKTTDIRLNPIPGNVKVVVSYSEELDEVYTDYYINMTTSHNKNNPLLYEKEETRPAFFKANAQNEQLTLGMIFKVNDEEYSYDKSIEIAPRDSVSLLFKLAPDEGGGENLVRSQGKNLK